MDFFVPVVESVIALGAFVLVCRFVGRLLRRRPPEEPDEGEPYAGVRAPLHPRTPRRAAKAAVEEPHEPDTQD